MEALNIKFKIQSIYPAFTKSERKVADYVLEHSLEVVNMTLLDIAKNSGVSEPSVLRFLNKIDMHKLIDFKIELAKSNRATKLRKGDTILEQLENDFIAVIKHTSNVLDYDNVKKAVDCIDKAGFVYFYGISASAKSALIAEENFMRMNVYSRAITDSHTELMISACINKDDVIIAFSLTGNTIDIYDACILAKNKGAKIIAITSYETSEIAKIADIVLLTSAKEDIINGGRITGSVSQLFVLDAIKSEYNKRHEQEVTIVKEEMGQAVITRQI